MAVGFDKIVQRDFSAGMHRGIRGVLIPENGAYDITNGLLDNTGNVYRRGGSSYRSVANFGTQILFVWDGWLTAGQRTVIASPAAFGILNGDGTVTSLGGSGVTAPVRASVLGGLLYLPGGVTFDGTSLGGAATTGTYYAVAGNRLFAATGSQVNFSGIYTGTGAPTFDPTDFHQMPEGVQIIGLQALRNAVAVFTTGGVWIISNIGFDLTDTAGNVQQRIDKYSSDLVLWGDAGIAAYEGGLVMPAMDGVWLLSLGVESEARVPFAQVSTSVQKLYRDYVAAGYTPGQACAFNGHYFLPILNAGVPVDQLVCRLDAQAKPWTHFSGFGGQLAALTVRTTTSSVRTPQLIGGSAMAGRVLNLNYFQQTVATASDADGSAYPFSIQPRDYPTGPLNENTIADVTLHYDMSGASTAITATQISGKQNVTGTRWGSFNWGGANWNSNPVTAPLPGFAPESADGQTPKTWPVAKRERFARFKFDSATAAAYLTIRAVVVRIRSSGEELMTTTVPNTFTNGTNADAVQVNADMAALAAAIDGVATEAGVLTPAVKMRGAVLITATEARSNTAYGLMTTPDRVTGIVLPTPGVIEVLYHAYWNESVDGAARAAIFIGSNQLQVSAVGAAAPTVQETQCAGAANITQPLSTGFFGLNGYGGTSIATGHSAPVTTGQVFAVQNTSGGNTDAAANPFSGGPTYIFAAAGTYDISVQFKASSGTVNVLNRRLFVQAKGY